MNRNRMTRGFAALAAVAVIVGACTTGGGATTAPSAAASAAPTAAASAAASEAASAPASAPASAATTQYKIGYSNGGGVGNGFREEQVCTAKAQAAASGQVSDLIVKHRNTDAAGQASDIRDLIAAGVQAIVFNPNDPEALNPALAEAQAQGIKTVSVDAYVTDPNTYNLYNNQVKYAEIGARWLFEQLGGKGKVWYTRGIAGNPADSDRDIGFKNALKDYPNIEVVPTADGVFTKWDPTVATQLTNDFISSGQYDAIQGIWASGMGKQIIDSIKAANKPFVPIADADVGGFVTQLLDPAGFPDLKGAAVTNTAAVGGAGITLALKLLNGETVTADPAATQPNTVLLDPVVVDNLTADGQAKLKAWQSVPGMDPLWPLSLSLDGWTTYDPNTVPAGCKGA
jgi:ribose transport system substrate-binding protein